jgi:hypothetical protein
MILHCFGAASNIVSNVIGVFLGSGDSQPHLCERWTHHWKQFCWDATHLHCVTYAKHIALWFQKRKKNSYLSSGVPPPTRQLTRSLRIEPRHEEKPPLSSAQDNSAGAQHRKASPQTSTVSASGSLSLHIPGLPASLTIERIQTSLCVVCRKPGEWTGFNWLLLIFWATM